MFGEGETLKVVAFPILKLSKAVNGSRQYSKVKRPSPYITSLQLVTSFLYAK